MGTLTAPVAGSGSWPACMAMVENFIPASPSVSSFAFNLAFFRRVWQCEDEEDADEAKVALREGPSVDEERADKYASEIRVALEFVMRQRKQPDERKAYAQKLKRIRNLKIE